MKYESMKYELKDDLTRDCEDYRAPGHGGPGCAFSSSCATVWKKHMLVSRSAPTLANPTCIGIQEDVDLPGLENKIKGLTKHAIWKSGLIAAGSDEYHELRKKVKSANARDIRSIGNTIDKKDKPTRQIAIRRIEHFKMQLFTTDKAAKKALKNWMIIDDRYS